LWAHPSAGPLADEAVRHGCRRSAAEITMPLGTTHVAHPPFDLGAECRAIAARLSEALFAGAAGREVRGGAAPASGGACDVTTEADPGVVPSNIVILLPFSLVDAMPFDGALEAARTMALGNVFGASHFLSQDKWLDSHEPVSPDSARVADVCLVRFLRAFQGLFAQGSPLWEHLDRYLNEYFQALSWERRVLQSADGARAARGGFEDSLVQAGRKMSPLKATVAGMALLAGRGEVIAVGERVVEDFHAAYQLADDIDDLAADLEGERWSLAAWFLASRSGLSSPAEAGGAAGLLRAAARAGALEELTGVICERYRRAASGADEMGAPILAAHLRRLLQAAERLLAPSARRLSVMEAGGGNGCAGPTVSGEAGPALLSGCPARRHLHQFGFDGRSFVYDRRSGLFFEADGAALDVLSWMRTGGSGAGLAVLKLDHGSAAVEEAVREIGVLGGPAFAADVPGDPRCPSLEGLKSVALNVAGGCNLACDYCYLGSSDGGPGLMSDEVAFSGVDLLFDESFGERELSVVFFGGEPLLNAGLIARTARHARHRAARGARRITFHVTTNGTLLTPEVAAMLRAEGVRILISVDGPASAHDSHRRFRNGSGTHGTIAANLRRLPRELRPGARATVCQDSPPLVEIVEHLCDLGFDVVHLAPVSDGPMSAGFASKLMGEYEALARVEREVVEGGGRPRAGCFVEPMVSLALGRRRLAPCGAGSRFVSVASDGGLFLCHRFAGDERYRVGDVCGGLDRFAVGGLLGDMAERGKACSECWALGLCGGPCFHDLVGAGDAFEGPGSQRCRVRLRVLELAMWLYASLPEKARTSLVERSRAVERPEMAAGRATRGRSVATAGISADEGR